MVFVAVDLFILFQCDEQEITRFDKCNHLQRRSYLSKVTLKPSVGYVVFYYLSALSQPRKNSNPSNYRLIKIHSVSM